MRILKAIFASAILAGTVGCGAQTVTLTGTGTPPAAPAIVVTPTAIAFGDVMVGGQSANQGVQVSSTGTAPLVVSALTLTGSQFALANPPKLPLTIAQGANATLSVGFDPTVVGDATGALSIVSNATVKPVVSVAIAGTVSAATFTVGLMWNAPVNETDLVVAYNVYRGVSGSGIYTRVNSNLVIPTVYTDAAVPVGNWDYMVLSVDASGVESAPSNIFTAVIP